MSGPSIDSPDTETPAHSSVSGITIAEEVPFARETFSETVAREAAARRPVSPRVIPFRKGPPPIPLASPGAAQRIDGSGVLPVEPPEPLAPALSTDFSGLTDPSTVIPPDTMGAAGPSHLVSALNSAVGIFNKATGAKLSEVTVEGFWASLGAGPGQPADFPFDPKVLYDQYSGCFVVVTLGGGSAPNSWLLIAVSATSDPTGTWNKWAIDANAATNSIWADFPSLGIDNNNVYVTANMFNNGGVYRYSKVWVLPKPQLLSGANPITWTEFANPRGSGFTMQPAHVFGAASAEYLVHEGYYIQGTSRRLVRVSSITFPSGTPIFTDLGFIEVSSYPLAALPNAPQAGSARLISTNDTRLLNAVMRNGTLWTTHTVPNGTNSRTEAAWYQLDPATASPTNYGTPVQQGRISDPNRFYYFPSVAVNAGGDAGVGFSGSSGAEFAGAFYTARAATDPPGTMQAVATLKAGQASYFKTFGGAENRWGDYSATCVDPTDDRTFWTLQEYAATPANTWGTWWGSFKMPRRNSLVDFDGDGKTDFAVWRPGNGTWYVLRSSDGGVTTTPWGSGSVNDVPVPGDYDGDGKTDFAVWRPGNGTWYVLRSSDGGVTTTPWGSGAANDVPVPGDYDGDGKTDVALWRPGNGAWYVLRSSDGGVTTTLWGSGSVNDVPVPGDYDGDGKTDFAVWRPGNGTWYVLRSSDGGVTTTPWGSGSVNDVPVPGDYDGDGKTDFAVWRPGNGTWYVLRSSDGGVTTTPWGSGAANDVPVPGDYDGDGKTDVALWRPGNGAWYVLRSSDGGVTMTPWGLGSAGDIPLMSLY